MSVEAPEMKFSSLKDSGSDQIEEGMSIDVARDEEKSAFGENFRENGKTDLDRMYSGCFFYGLTIKEALILGIPLDMERCETEEKIKVKQMGEENGSTS